MEIETSRMWGMRTETIPVIIGALGAIEKGLETYLGRIPGQLSISELQKITLLGTAHILRRVLAKTGYPLVPQDHGLISALETLSKHYVRTIIIITFRKRPFPTVQRRFLQG